MEKNKMFYITLVLVVCVVFTGIGCFYLGTKFGENSSNVDKKEGFDNKGSNNDNKKDNTSYIEELLSVDISDITKMGLYNYSKSGKSSLKEYFNSLNNSQKLDLAGLALGSEDLFKNLEQNLINTYGSNLGLEAKDFYYTGINVPMYIYDSASGKYIDNEDAPGIEFATNLGDISLYNYRLKNIKKDGDNYIVSYYGLYETNMYQLGPTWLKNNKNIDRANVDNAESYGGDGTSIDYYLATAFNNNKSDFLVFEYIFNKKNNNYYIVDFKVR